MKKDSDSIHFFKNIFILFFLFGYNTILNTICASYTILVFLISTSKILLYHINAYSNLLLAPVIMIMHTQNKYINIFYDLKYRSALHDRCTDRSFAPVHSRGIIIFIQTYSHDENTVQLIKEITNLTRKVKTLQK